MSPVLSISTYERTLNQNLVELSRHLGEILTRVRTSTGPIEVASRRRAALTADVSGWCGGSAYDY